VVAAARAVLDPQLLRVGKRILQQRFEAIDGHRFQRTLWPVAEIGLFPLGIVLLPTEQVPLHIFEPRYRELIGECIAQDVEFGLLYADEEGIRETGTRTAVAAVLERFDDGRLNIVVVGGQRFTVDRLTHGRSFMTAETSDVDDEPGEVDDATRAAALGTFRALAALADVEVELDESSPELSFQLAAQVELAPDEKQFLLESRSEQERLERVAELLDNARRTLIATRELNEKAKRNGHR
jgi:Lon protease-like protein